MQKSIEVEYWVIDRDGELTEPGELTDTSEYTEEEFVEPLFELKTPPCESIDELRRTFIDQLETVCSRAEDRGLGLVPLGTPINGDPIERVPGERGRIQREVVGAKFAYAKYCAGTHLHFEQRNVTDQLNTLIALDPALALVNSSPYFRGDRIANGARSYIYRKKSYEEFPKHGQLWHYADTVAQWNRRLERRFEEFAAAAASAGVEEDVFEEHFSPDDVVWTPVRLREEMPTVEWRSPDATLPSQILRLAADVDAVMETLHHTSVDVAGETGHVSDEGITLPEFDPLCDLAEAAIHHGLESDAVADYLERMGFDVGAYHPISTRIDGRAHVTATDARDLRVEYAKRLEADVDALVEAIDA